MQAGHMALIFQFNYIDSMSSTHTYMYMYKSIHKSKSACVQMYTCTYTWITLKFGKHCRELVLKNHCPCCMYTNTNISPNEKVFAMGKLSLKFLCSIIA